MTVFRTPTPSYKGQPGSQAPDVQPSGLFGWFASLFRTRTPAYTYPDPPAEKDSDPTDKATRKAKQ